MKSYFLFVLALCLSNGGSDKPSQPPAPTACSAVQSQSDCDGHSFGHDSCEWVNGQCIINTTCPQYSNQANCNDSQYGCAWNLYTLKCAKENTQCGQNNTAVLCTKAVQGCYWNNNQCLDDTGCKQIQDAGICAQSALGCAWDLVNKSCRKIDATCGQITTQSGCKSSTL